MMPQTALQGYLQVLVLIIALSRSEAAVQCESNCPQIAEGSAFLGGPPDTVLAGHVYREMGSRTRLQCLASCAKNPSHCYSFNYCGSTKTCQLSSVNQARQPHNMTEREGCSYYDIFVECETTAKGDYVTVFLPAEAYIKRVEFQVKSSAGAAMILSPERRDHNPLYEIVLGAAGNKEGAIRRCKLCPNKVTVTEPDLLSASEFRGFWVTFDQVMGKLAVGRAGQLEPFMAWVDPSPIIDVKYVGFVSWYGNPGQYRYLCSI